MIAGYLNPTPREDMLVAEKEDAVEDVAAAAVTTMYLTGTTQLMAGFMEYPA